MKIKIKPDKQKAERDFRNRISYEGFMVNKNYIKLSSEKIKKIINILFSKVGEEKNQTEKKE